MSRFACLTSCSVYIAALLHLDGRIIYLYCSACQGFIVYKNNLIYYSFELLEYIKKISHFAITVKINHQK